MIDATTTTHTDRPVRAFTSRVTFHGVGRAVDTLRGKCLATIRATDCQVVTATYRRVPYWPHARSTPTEIAGSRPCRCHVDSSHYLCLPLSWTEQHPGRTCPGYHVNPSQLLSLPLCFMVTPSGRVADSPCLINVLSHVLRSGLSRGLRGNVDQRDTRRLIPCDVTTSRAVTVPVSRLPFLALLWRAFITCHGAYLRCDELDKSSPGHHRPGPPQSAQLLAGLPRDPQCQVTLSLADCGAYRGVNGRSCRVVHVCDHDQCFRRTVNVAVVDIGATVGQDFPQAVGGCWQLLSYH